MTEPSQPLLPPGTGPKLGRALLDLLAALLWFVLALLCGSDSTDLLGTEGGTNDVFAFIAIAGAVALLPLPEATAALLAATAASLLLATWLGRRLGGCTGDTLGAVQQTAEIAFLLAVASRH